MFEISDEAGNSCIVEDKDLALIIIKNKSNPFINLAEIKDDKLFKDRHVIKTMEDFICYFY